MALDLTNEKLILGELSRGNAQAFQYIFDKYYAELVRYGIGYVRIPEISEEIVQEILISLWDRREIVEIKASLSAYLHTSVRYRAINYIKNQLPKDQRNFDVDGLEEALVAPDNADTEDVNAHLNNAIDSLPPKCRAIFVMARIDGLSHKEIARELGINEKTIESQITIAFKKLRAYLQPFKDKGLTIPVIFFLADLFY